MKQAISWHRRGLAVLLACAAVLSALTVLAPPEPVTVPVVVTAHRVSSGTTLQADDLTVREVPPGLVPEGTPSDPAELLGRLSVVDLPSGAMLVSGLTLAPTAAKDGARLVPVTVADPAVASLVRPGDQISIIAVGTNGEPVVVAERVRVAAIPSASDGGPLGGGVRSSTVLVVSAPPATAQRIAAWASNPTLGITIG